MANIVILILVAALLVVACKGTVKHFKGEGPCCGGGGGAKSLPPVPEKSLAGPVIETKTIRIGGMHCQNCVNAVTRAINKVDGASARVSLKEEKAMVSCDRKLENDLLYKAVEAAGYQVKSIDV